MENNQLSWEKLEESGWTKTTSAAQNRVVYIRPSGTMVRQKRDLSSSEKVTLGNILFPPKRSKTQSLLPPPVSVQEESPTDQDQGEVSATGSPNVIFIRRKREKDMNTLFHNDYTI